MLKEIEELFKLNRTLVGNDFDNALFYIKELLPEMKILEFKTGAEYGTWKIPQKWEVKNAWIKYKGEKIIDYKKEPLSLLVYSIPIHGIIQLKELKEHLCFHSEIRNAIPYNFQYYDKTWAFNISLEQYEKLKEGKYEIFIDTEYSDSTLKIGEYKIENGDKEILIMSHIDHPFQANDDLSGVTVAIDLAKKLKCKHKIKFLFLPETIGSIVYAYTQDLSKIDFGIMIDMVGNDNTPLMQESFFEADKINLAGTMAMSIISPIHYRKAPFRALVGADEYVFNDPKIGIPSILFTRYSYPEYHTNLDMPNIIKEDKLEEMAKIIEKTIEIMENDWIPEREFKAPLMRARYKVQQLTKEENRKYDYFFYLMDGKRSVLELSYACQLNFEKMNDLLKRIQKDGFIKSIQ